MGSKSASNYSSGVTDLLFIYNSAGTVIDINTAELLDGELDYTNIDMLLLHSDAITGNDDDGDSVLNDDDNCRFVPNLDQADINSNGIGALCDVMDEELCVPVVTANGSLALICL